MKTVTLKLDPEMESRLKKLKDYKNESYVDVIKKVVFVANPKMNKFELSKKDLKDIKKAREQIKRGEFFTSAEVKKRLGL